MLGERQRKAALSPEPLPSHPGRQFEQKKAGETSGVGGVAGMAGSDPQSAKELSQFAENLLQQLQENFEDLTDKLSLKMDEMGERINDLEKHVAELMAEAGIENANGDSERTEGIKETLDRT